MSKPRKIRKEVVDFHINETTSNETGKPADFSFSKIKKLEAIPIEGARSSRIGSIPVKTDDQRYLTRAIWVNNNKLTNIENMDKFVESIIQKPETLAWIDFSFNYITNISDSILKYKNLKIIYFHGNHINNMDELVKLRDLKELRSITFHGNPICEHPKYRNFVISILPNVVNLDFTPVIKSERLMPTLPEALKKLSEGFGFEEEEENIPPKPVPQSAGKPDVPQAPPAPKPALADREPSIKGAPEPIVQAPAPMVAQEAY